MAFVPHKSPMLGFSLQANGLGDYAKTQAEVVFPLRDGTDFKPKRSKEFYQGNAGNYERGHYYTSSLITEGTINVPLVPLMLLTSTASGLYNWCFGREVAAPFQGGYATIYEFLGNACYAVFRDVKCTGGGFKVDFGKTVDLSIKALGGAMPRVTGDGLGAGNGEFGAEPTSTIFPEYATAKWFDQKPYTFDSVVVQIGAATATPATDIYTKSHAPEWDNMVLGADEASTLVYGRLGPYAQPNTARAQWHGSFSRYFFDLDILNAYMSGSAEGSYKLQFNQGASRAALTFPRIVFSDGGWPSLPGSGVMMYDGVAFDALGGLGVPGTPCFTWTEA
jgi:hypothetical protein